MESIKKFYIAKHRRTLILTKISVKELSIERKGSEVVFTIRQLSSLQGCVIIISSQSFFKEAKGVQEPSLIIKE